MTIMHKFSHNFWLKIFFVLTMFFVKKNPQTNQIVTLNTALEKQSIENVSKSKWHTFNQILTLWNCIEKSLKSKWIEFDDGSMVVMAVMHLSPAASFQQCTTLNIEESQLILVSFSYPISLLQNIHICPQIWFLQGVPKKVVDSESFTPGDDNNTQQQYSTSGPIVGPFCDNCIYLCQLSRGNVHFRSPDTPYTQ